jgi:hypothetical protein
MISFRAKYPGLSEDQLRIKYKIWQREKETQRLLNEAEEKKKYKDPFSKKNENGEEGAYDGGLDIVFGHTGVVSDAALVGARVDFLYAYSGGLIKTAITDSEGRFNIPSSFGSGEIVVSGGIDAVNGLPYRGGFRIDPPFFHKYQAITPLTHIASHIWKNTPTRIPQEALTIVLDYLPDFFGVKMEDVDHSIFCKDPVLCTLEGVSGAKEIQAINTLIEVYADLISGLKSNNSSELEAQKLITYREIGDALLTRINGQESRNYFENVFKFHISGQKKNHDDCCLELINKASGIIKDSLDLESVECTSNIQSINLAVKSEWMEKALIMTEDKGITSSDVWRDIENKKPEDLINQLNIPTV